MTEVPAQHLDAVRGGADIATRLTVAMLKSSSSHALDPVKVMMAQLDAGARRVFYTRARGWLHGDSLAKRLMKSALGE
jgi:hypothetical protein